MATNDPLAKLAADVPPVSLVKHVIAGIEVDVYGAEEVKPDVENVTCLWLLNPRLGNRQQMRPIANAAVNHWNKIGTLETGLIVAAFDQRNHGSRKIDELANQSWRDEGTAIDTSQLITYLPAYVFPKNEHIVVDHVALGISLGGHSVWHLLLHEPRIRTGIVIVGCPDYIGLSSDRARLSKLKTWTRSEIPGSDFIGSEDFPAALVEAVRLYDPVGFFFGTEKHDFDLYDNKEQQERQAELLKKTLHSKRLLNLAGGADKLVPYAKAAPFMSWLKKATGPDGWCGNINLTIKDIVYPGVGHETTPEMLKESLDFLTEADSTFNKTVVPKL